MKIAAISDTHNKHKNLTIENCDILIHAGDESSRGYKHEIESFAKWLNTQDATHIIWTPGNHSVEFEKSYPESKEWILNNCPRCTILINEEVTINGIKFWGSPFTPAFGHGWAYNAGRDIVESSHIFKPFIGDIWSKIPDDTNVLITHGMPLGCLDEVLHFSNGRILNVGDKELLKRIETLNDLKYTIGGHLHLNGGKSLFTNNVTYINAAMCDDSYNCYRSPVYFNI